MSWPVVAAALLIALWVFLMLVAIYHGAEEMDDE